MTLPNKKNILQLAALLKAHGVKKIVACPGNRNIPLTEAFCAIPDFRCYAMTDERNAGFYALGLALHDGAPVAVVCNAGSALLNLYPAVAEAYQQQVPLIVISPTQPTSCIGQTARQAIEQSDIFSSIIKAYATLPIASNSEEEWQCNCKINEVLLESHHHGKGPVHLNITIGDPLLERADSTLPTERVIERFEGLNMYNTDYEPLIQKLNKMRSRMIVAGQMNMIYEFDKKAQQTLNKQFVWLTENLSNQTTPSSAIHRIDELLYPMSKEQQEKLKPELLITFGGAITSRRLMYFLQNHKPVEHWHVAKDGKMADMFHGALTTIIEMDPFEFLQKISTMINDIPSSYPKQWELLASKLPEARFEYSDMSAIGLLMKNLPKSCALHLGNSAIANQAQMFGLANDVEVQSNCGLAGPEGVLPTALGYATASERLNFLIVGDLSFFSSMNALWNSNYGSNIRIMLLNNGGSGSISSILGQETEADAQRAIIGAHQANACTWAKECGFDYLSARNADELENAIPAFITPSVTKSPILLEVFTDKEENARLLKSHLKQLK